MERGGQQQDDERRAGVAAGAEHGGIVVVEETEDKPREHQLEVHRRLLAHGLLRALCPQQQGGQKDARRGDEHRQHRAADKGRGIEPPHPVPVLRAAEVGAQHTGADRAADDECIGHVHDGGGHADAGQRQIAQKFPHHHGVHDAVQLLEDVAQNDGQREVEQRRKRCAGQQRLVAAGPVVHPTTCFPEFTTGKPITYPSVCPHPLLFVRRGAAEEAACFRRRRTLRGLPEFWTRRSAGFGKNCIDRGKNVLYNKSQEQISAKENYA